MTLSEKLALLRHPRLKGPGEFRFSLSDEAREWSAAHPDFRSAWEACKEGTWLWWLVEALELPEVADPAFHREANQRIKDLRSDSEDPNLTWARVIRMLIPTWARVIRMLIPTDKVVAAFENYTFPAEKAAAAPGLCPTCGQPITKGRELLAPPGSAHRP